MGIDNYGMSRYGAFVTRECDMCGEMILMRKLTETMMEKHDWLMYCKECADSLGLTPELAKKDKIRIFNREKKV